LCKQKAIVTDKTTISLKLTIFRSNSRDNITKEMRKSERLKKITSTRMTSISKCRRVRAKKSSEESSDDETSIEHIINDSIDESTKTGFESGHNSQTENEMSTPKVNGDTKFNQQQRHIHCQAKRYSDNFDSIEIEKSTKKVRESLDYEAHPSRHDKDMRADDTVDNEDVSSMREYDQTSKNSLIEPSLQEISPVLPKSSIISNNDPIPTPVYSTIAADIDFTVTIQAPKKINLNDIGELHQRYKKKESLFKHVPEVSSTPTSPISCIQLPKTRLSGSKMTSHNQISPGHVYGNENEEDQLRSIEDVLNNRDSSYQIAPSFTDSKAIRIADVENADEIVNHMKIENPNNFEYSDEQKTSNGEKQTSSTPLLFNLNYTTNPNPPCYTKMKSRKSSTKKVSFLKHDPKPSRTSFEIGSMDLNLDIGGEKSTKESSMVSASCCAEPCPADQHMNDKKRSKSHRKSSQSEGNFVNRLLPQSKVESDGTKSSNIVSNSFKADKVIVNGNDYIKMNLLGKGGSSSVYRVLASDMSLCAFKKIQVSPNLDDCETVFDSYLNEISLLQKLKGSKHIIQILDHEINREDLTISMIMEAGEVDLAKV
jgi:hypothetical protein